jgi:hypothetical protein
MNPLNFSLFTLILLLNYLLILRGLPSHTNKEIKEKFKQKIGMIKIIYFIKIEYSTHN